MVLHEFIDPAGSGIVNIFFVLVYDDANHFAHNDKRLISVSRKYQYQATYV